MVLPRERWLMAPRCLAPALGGSPLCELQEDHEGQHAFTEDERTFRWGGGGPLRRSPAPPGEKRLGNLGQVYVTLAAATRYAEQRNLRAEEARRELTELLIEGRVQDDGAPMRVRARSRPSGVDITARVAREGRLLVVVAAETKDYR